MTLCLVLGLGAGTAQAGRFFGVVNPFETLCADTQTGGNCLSSKDLRRMSRAKLHIVRWGFRWSVVQPTPTAHNWRPLDEVIGALANRGIRVLPVMTGTPQWAGPKSGAAPVGTRVARDGWSRFLKAAVRRYGPGGDYWTDPDLYRSAYPAGPNEPIGTWQIWNEPNLRKGAQHVRPGKYVRLLRISHDAIRSADPRARILLAGLPGYVRTHAWTYLDELYRHRGFKRDVDAVAIHPYAGDVYHVFLQIWKTLAVMKRHHDMRSGIWITELGWGSKPPSKDQPINKGVRGQKRMLKETFPLLRRTHKRWHIKRAFWFRWRDPPRGTRACTFCTSSGLFRHNQKPKPSWRAFKRLTTR